MDGTPYHILIVDDSPEDREAYRRWLGQDPERRYAVRETGSAEEGLLLWIALTMLGWLQWFVLLPWVARKARKATDFLFKRFFAR